MMTTIQISGSVNKSEILVGESISNFYQYVPGNRIVVVTDINVHRLYGQFWSDFPAIVLETGEDAKTLQTVEKIVHELLLLNAGRNTFLLGIGGGIVCDITGFAASIFMRGLRFGFISTTLLSQVDASVGGKNGVNFDGFKNVVGVFNQPDFVICDPEVLHTLPKEEISNGFAEIVKHAIIRDEKLFEFLEKSTGPLQNLDKEAIQHVVETSVRIKADIVNRDENEKGERRLLNFGHTFGHAIEKVTGSSHGKSVSLGMVIACRLSLEMGYLKDSDFERIIVLLKKLYLPIEGAFDFARIREAIIKDKKREDDSIHFVLTERPGSAFVEKLPVEKILNFHF